MMRLRTVHINTQPNWGGGEQQTLLLVRGLVARGHEAVLATRPDSPLGRRAIDAGVEVFPINPINEIDPRAIWKLAGLLRAQRPHVLHMHSPHALALGSLAARLAPRALRLVSRRVARSIYRRRTLRLNWLKYRLGAQQYVAVSRAVKDILVRDGMRADTISVVHSGIDPETPERVGRHGSPGVNGDGIRRRHDFPAGIPIVLTVGSLHRIKGPWTLLRAASVILARRDVAFISLGDGPLATALRDQARSDGIAHRVRWIGFREDVLSYIAASNIYVQPSLSEGLGTSILDALLVERPVVACRVDGIPEIIEHGRHGLLVPPDDASALAAAIDGLLDAPRWGRELGARGRERVLREFTTERMVEGTLAVYQAALGGDGAR